MLASIRTLNRLQCAQETMRAALSTLAVVAPEWLKEHSQAEWMDTYGPRAEDYRLPPGKEKRLSLALMFGADGHALLPDIFAEDVPVWLRQAPAIETLRRVWVQQYYAQGGAITWRTRQKQGMPRSDHFTSSSYDLDAHLARKRSTHWIGYKVPLTESCEEDQPHLITHVKAAAGPVADGDMAPDIHQALSDKDLLPKVHLLGIGTLTPSFWHSQNRTTGSILLARRDPNTNGRREQKKA